MSLRRTSKDLNFLPSFLPSLLRQNLDKNQNLDKQINSFHIPKEFPKNSPKNSQKIIKILKISNSYIALRGLRACFVISVST